MEQKKFQKKTEDFVCNRCGTKVTGSGFTNHCPKCLWSRHVDFNPGDRAESCGGMMKPARLERDHGENILIHRCEKCGKEKRNKTAANDDAEEILKIASSENSL